MKDKMTVFYSEGKGKGCFSKIDIPKAEADMVVVKIHYCGVCGTDQDLFSGECSFAKNGEVTYPLRSGHEWSGTVAAVGEMVTRFKPDDRVVGDNAITCGECDACKSGNYGKCCSTRNVGTIDPVYDGSFAEYFVIPERHLYKIPDCISLKEATLCEPLSVAYGGIKKMDICEDSCVVVIGTGCIGMSAVVLARCAGAGQVIMIGRNSKKLETARNLGCEIINTLESDPEAEIMKITGGRGADFVLECSGAHGTFLQAINITARRGKIALIGFYENNENNVCIDKIVSKEITIVGIMGEFGNIGAVLDILRTHEPVISPIITDELPFADCKKALLRDNYPDSVKIIIEINRE